MLKKALKILILESLKKSWTVFTGEISIEISAPEKRKYLQNHFKFYKKETSGLGF